MVWDKYNGFEMDIFRLPVACSCFIRPPHSAHMMARTYGPLDPRTTRSKEKLPEPGNDRFTPPRTGHLIPIIQTSETDKRYSYMPPDGPPVDPYLYYHYLTNILPIQSVRYFSPGTPQIDSPG